jgi:homoserine O-acetyltransferase
MSPTVTRSHNEEVAPYAPAPLRRDSQAADGDLQTINIGSLSLERGGSLRSVDIAYRTWGTLNARGDNAVLILHALTGDTQATGEAGWWSPMIGPGLPIDTSRHFVLSSNVLGGCAGSTGPASIDPSTGHAYGVRFPLATIGDMVAAQRRLIDRLGIRQVVVIGGSIGGFQALEWATRHPERVAGAVVIAASASLGAQAIAAHSEIGRRAIMADPWWHGGDYARFGAFPETGLAIARMAAMITYQSRESMNARFGRNLATRPSQYPIFGDRFDVETYLHHQGDRLVQRFDANSYLYLTRAMDLYDVGRDGGLERWLRRLRAPVLMVGIRTDWLFPPEDVEALARLALDLGADAAYAELDSPYGHDAFLKEWRRLDDIIRPFVERLTRDQRPVARERRAMAHNAW